MFFLNLVNRQSEAEAGSAQLRLRVGNLSSALLDYAPRYGKAQSVSAGLGGEVRLEELFQILRADTPAVVVHANLPEISFP